MKSSLTEVSGADKAQGMLQRRKDVVIVDPALVNVAFRGNGADAALYCVPCSEILAWDKTNEIWICQECGIDVTPTEQIEYAKIALKAIKELKKDGKRRKGSWLRRT